MGKYVDMLKAMGDMTISHTENVMRVTEGLCNGGVAITTDKDGNQGIFTPATRKGSFKSLEMFKKIAEKNGLSVNVVRPDWATKEEQPHQSKKEKENQPKTQPERQQQSEKPFIGIMNKKKAESVARHLISKGLDPNKADEWIVDDDGKYKSMITGESPSKYDKDGAPILVSMGELRYRYDPKTGKMEEIDPNNSIDTTEIGDLDIEVDDNGNAKVKGKNFERDLKESDLSAYHEGLLDACKMLGIDLPEIIDGDGKVITKDEAIEFLKSKEGQKVVEEVVAKLTGELGGGNDIKKKDAEPEKKKPEKKAEKEEKKEEKKEKGEKKKVPYQFREPDEKSQDFLNKHIKEGALEAAMASEEFDEKRRNYVKNIIISEIEWAYKRGDKFFPKEDDFVKFDIESISKNNVIYLVRPDLRMVIVPFRWDRKIYRIFTRTQDEAKNVAEINAWIEGKVREEEVRNQQLAEEKKQKEAEKKAEETSAA